MNERKKLSDILRGVGNGSSWLNNGNNGGGWDDITPAPERGPVPPGRYVTHIIDGVLFNARSNTPGYKITFEIIEGEYKGRRCWYDVWLTDKNQANAVRDLRKLGIDRKEKLEQLLPRGIRSNIRVTLRKSDTGDEYNEVKEFQVIGIDPPTLDPFAPASAPSNPEGGPTS